MCISLFCGWMIKFVLFIMVRVMCNVYMVEGEAIQKFDENKNRGQCESCY